MADDKRDGDDLFEDLDKFFAPIKDVDWDEPASAGSRETPSEEHVAVTSGGPQPQDAPEPEPAAPLVSDRRRRRRRVVRHHGPGHDRGHRRRGRASGRCIRLRRRRRGRPGSRRSPDGRRGDHQRAVVGEPVTSTAPMSTIDDIVEEGVVATEHHRTKTSKPRPRTSHHPFETHRTSWSRMTPSSEASWASRKRRTTPAPWGPIRTPGRSGRRTAAERRCRRHPGRSAS